MVKVLRVLLAAAIALGALPAQQKAKQNGKPDRIETHPAGGPYQRPWHEGGGHTSTYPFERWEYRHLEGIGDDIEIEFVDYSGGNLYKISHNPLDKDEFAHVPWAGMTDAEENPIGRDSAELRWRRVAGIRD